MSNLASNHHLIENRTMNPIETMKLKSFIEENFNRSAQTVKASFNQPLNKSIKEDKELYHFYKVIIVFILLRIVLN